MLVEITNILFVGHLNDPVALASVGLGNMVINITSYSIGMGLNGAIDTLVTQAYGDKEFYLWGCYLNRGRIVQLLAFIPQVFILLNTKSILMFLGQEEITSAAAESYVVVLMPGMFAMIQFELVRRFLQGMTIFALTMYIQFAMMILHFFWCYLFVFYLEYGLVGSAMATVITYTSDLVAVTLILTYKSNIIPPESWHFFNSDSFRGLLEFLEYGIPAAFMLCLEWWSFEFFAIYAGMLGIYELASNVIFLNITMLLFQVPLGMQFAISNLVGNSLGEMKSNKAKKYAISSIGLIFLCSVIVGTTLFYFRKSVPRLFTEDEYIIKIVSDNIPIFTFMVFFDYQQGVLWGVIRAMGKQTIGSVLAFISYWIINLPIVYVFAFLIDLRITGIWVGAQIGVFIVCSSYAYVVFSTNWKQLIIEINERIESEKDQLTHPLLYHQDDTE